MIENNKPTALVKQETPAALLEKVVIGGDLAKLSSDERLCYYNHLCNSLGLNPLTRPFEYINLNGKLTLYATKNCTEQLRNVHDISITKLEREFVDGCFYTVVAYGKNKNGREDSSLAAVNIENLRGEAKANAMMKTETKAKRRLTLSICGLGVLDEDELETVIRPAIPEPLQPQGAIGEGTVSGTSEATEPQPRNAFEHEIAKKKEKLQEIMLLPCFTDSERDTMYSTTAKATTLESIDKILTRVQDTAKKRAKEQSKKDKEAQLGLVPEDADVNTNSQAF